jgi:membrane protease YdiL (CAAX protease family)
MRDTFDRPATGFQIVVFIFAFLILGAAAEKYVFAPVFPDLSLALGRIATFAAAAAILFGVPPLRRKCLSLLSVPFRPGMAMEVGAALSIQVVCGLAVIGAMALWWWSTGGEPALARHMGRGFVDANPWQRAFSSSALINTFIVGAILAPIIEELVFRGILYRTWEAKWGWVKSAVATSAAFALVHPFVVPQFFSSLVLVCLLRRTGSLRACIACHAALNIALWYPLLGQFTVPGPARETGALRAWAPHLICLLLAFFALAIYMWISRDEAIAARQPMSGEAAPQGS